MRVGRRLVEGDKRGVVHEVVWRDALTDKGRRVLRRGEGRRVLRSEVVPVEEAVARGGSGHGTGWQWPNSRRERRR